MNLFKKASLCLFVSFYGIHAHSQESVSTEKVKEVGIGFNSLNSYSLQYRWGNTQRLYRITGNISQSFDKNNRDYTNYNDPVNQRFQTIKPINFSTGLSFAILKFKPFNEKLSFMYGPQLGYTYSYSKTETEIVYPTIDNNQTYYTSINQTDKTTFHKPNLGMVIGFSYKVSPSIFLYSEIVPNIYYSYTTGKSNTSDFDSSDNTTVNYYSDSKTHSFGLSSLGNSNAMISLMYRF